MFETWQQAAEVALGQRIVGKHPLSGGDFATAYRAELADGQSVFVKTHKNPPANFFSTEATGLQWLRESNSVNIPKVLACSDDPPFLVLEWIAVGQGVSSNSRRGTEERLGVELAALHRTTRQSFGRQDRRTTGSLGVPNEPQSQWSEFYATQRLLPLAEIASQRKSLSATDCKALQAVAENLAQVDVPQEPPSLLHGDLWAGNRLVDSDGRSWLIDPAAHAGHREFDLAMMQLFGGYSQSCFDAYHEAWPLQPGYRQRVALHQLAPLTVHAIKFGGSYRSAVHEALEVCQRLPRK